MNDLVESCGCFAIVVAKAQMWQTFLIPNRYAAETAEFLEQTTIQNVSATRQNEALMTLMIRYYLGSTRQRQQRNEQAIMRIGAALRERYATDFFWVEADFDSTIDKVSGTLHRMTVPDTVPEHKIRDGRQALLELPLIRELRS